MFNKNPQAARVSHLYCTGLCKKAQPNDGHRALASMEFNEKNRYKLITVGTIGITMLPNPIINLVHSNGGLMFDINVADNPFAGLAIQGRVAESLSSAIAFKPWSRCCAQSL